MDDRGCDEAPDAIGEPGAAEAAATEVDEAEDVELEAGDEPAGDGQAADGNAALSAGADDRVDLVKATIDGVRGELAALTVQAVKGQVAEAMQGLTGELMAKMAEIEGAVEAQAGRVDLLAADVEVVMAQPAGRRGINANKGAARPSAQDLDAEIERLKEAGNFHEARRLWQKKVWGR